MKSRSFRIAAGAASGVLLAPSAAVGQSDGNQPFVSDPYLSGSDSVFADPFRTAEPGSPLNLDDAETLDGFAADPFRNNSQRTVKDEGAQDQSQGLRNAGTTAETGVGNVGQRQTANDTAFALSPLFRIDSRIHRRLENRLRNRIDPNYDPAANATSPFEAPQRKPGGQKEP